MSSSTKLQKNHFARRHFSYSQTESVDSVVEVILNLLSLAWEVHCSS